MNIDPSALAAVVGILSSIASAFVTAGILKAKVEANAERINKLETEHKDSRDRYIDHDDLKNRIGPIDEAIKDIRGDLKEVLKLVSVQRFQKIKRKPVTKGKHK